MKKILNYIIVGLLFISCESKKWYHEGCEITIKSKWFGDTLYTYKALNRNYQFTSRVNLSTHPHGKLTKGLNEND